MKRPGAKPGLHHVESCRRQVLLRSESFTPPMVF